MRPLAGGRRYVITNHRIIVRFGLIARNGRDMPLSRVNDVSFSHTVDQISNCGTITVESAGEKGQLTMRGVPNVETISATSSGSTTRTTCAAAAPRTCAAPAARRGRRRIGVDQQEGAEPDAGKVVDDLVDVVLGSPRRLTRDEVAHLSGVPLDESRSLWRAMGFADVGDAAAFTDEDVDALVLLSTLGAAASSTTRPRSASSVPWAAPPAGSRAGRSVRSARARPSRCRRPGRPAVRRVGGAPLREIEVLLPALERLVVRRRARRGARARPRRRRGGRRGNRRWRRPWASPTSSEFTRLLEPRRARARDARGPLRVALGRHRRGGRTLKTLEATRSCS
ncbi:MAG: PH domain-containing protein [Candidatus Nanopelagicales bacterium]